jgi:hypothetical protein
MMRNVLMLAPVLLIALTVVGIVLITLGVRGRPVFASPRCRKCGYDLRNMQFMSSEIGACPECGAALSGTEGVTFGRWQRRPKQIVIGILLLALPWAGVIPAMYLFRRAGGPVAGPTGVAAQTTPALLASLPKAVNSPWEWQELERRLTAGNLTTADVDAAFSALATRLNANRAAGQRRQPPHWYGNFVAAALKSNVPSQPAIDALCQAFYGQVPPMTMRKLAREGEPIPIVLNEHESWDLNGLRRVWAITDITAGNGSKLMAQQRYGPKAPLPPDALSGSGREGNAQVALVHALAPGEHELTFAYTVGVVPDSTTFVGLDGKPGTPGKWPPAVARWTATVKQKITVVVKDQPLVALVTDPARDPFKSSAIAVEQLLARPSSRGVELVIKWKVTSEPSPVVAYRVWLQAGAEKINYGTLVAGKLPDGSISSYSSSNVVKSLPPDLTTVDVLLTPDPKAAEQHIGLEEIWGQPLEIKGVTLERFDRSAATTPTGS